ncbi:hypothetical protein RhiirA4_472074 [Rhizophagus irregularis]|uniref:Uncharacterized protein n=1 Tax=Rhizophagus irregularis TaxID=588596 RepID=A0A2I1H4A7_9GLOM|nr:hypothetical protein RhiirA4_472074 [Rhizophagus irregularis]
MLCLLLIAIQNDNQSFKLTDADLNDVIGNNNVNVDVNFQIESTNLKEPTSGFGITEWNSSNTSKILTDVMEKLHTCFLNTLEEYEIMNKDAEKRPVFRFIHEEHTSSKSSCSVVTNARGIYLIVVIVVAPSDSQRVIKRQQGLMDAKQLKEQFRLANINNEKVRRRPVMDLQEEMLQQDLRSVGCYDDVDIDDCEYLVIEELSEEEMDEQSSNQQQTSVYKSLLYIMVQVMPCV